MLNALKKGLIALCIAMNAPMVFAATLTLADSPLYGNQAVAPLTLLIMGRDHKLYYEAYNDASDIDGDGEIELRFKPAIIYYGYFDPTKCYSYGSSVFTPVSSNGSTSETGLVGATCGGSNWSGNFLNYLTTSRMDALRKVLYGGYRSTDTTTSTVLERSYIPQDAHSWGKEYTSTAVDGYNINQFTPLSQPTGGNRHLFANTTLLAGTQPLLRVATNQPNRIWEWLSIERPVADSQVATGNNVRTNISSITDYVVRVKVCVTGLLEENCKAYGSTPIYKPTGLLQDLGEDDSMKFGLLTGSYGKNMSGGVLRKNVGSINDEIDPTTGIFTSTVGIISTLNRLKIMGFGSGYQYSCGFFWDRDMNEGECRDWGNPIAEMMYEGLRYFAGKSGPTAAYNYSGGDDSTLGLPAPAWVNPYASSTQACAQPNMLVISDINPSYDSDQVPGSYFNSFTGDLSPALNVATLGQTIWNNEFGGSRQVFIGQSGAVNDGNPTAKTVTSFGNIRGLSPEEPNKQGSYYSASVAMYGHNNDISSATGAQNVYTYAVALASPLPEIKIPVNGNTVTILPFAKSVGGCGPNGLQGFFQPTNTIVDFYVESLTSTTGSFRINFEDAQQGADHDMDAIVRYSYVVNADNTVSITLDSQYAAGCVIQHIGYVISGTTADGVYLEVRDSDTSSLLDFNYYLDTPNLITALPLTATRTFTPSNSSSTAITLKNPLWYAAKWGSFNDINNNNIPDLQDEYDLDHDGEPDNYFLVTNALTLKDKITKALANISNRISSASSAAINSSTLNANTRVFQAIYDNKDWTGHFLAFSLNTSTGEVNTNGSALNGSIYDAADVLAGKNYNTGREILSYRPDTKTGIGFRYNNLSTAQKNLMKTDPVNATTTSSTIAGYRLDYIRGDRSREQSNGGSYRTRNSLLGDIVNSSPQYVGAPDFIYPDNWGTGAAENSSPYSAFKSGTAKNRRTMVYVGANDGMLHAFDSATGDERFAYVPSAVIGNLNKLTVPGYSHRFYVDGTPTVGDVFIGGAWKTVLIGGLDGGGQGIYALDITNPDTVTEANAASKVLWEFTDASVDGSNNLIAKDLGFTFSRPAIVRLATGQWAAVFGNGYNNTASGNSSTTGNAVLFVVDIATGQLIKKLDTGAGMTVDPAGVARPNGLSTPAVVDTNSDSIADIVYAGDLQGNLWKFDISNSNTSNWTVANGGVPLFTAQFNASVLSTRQAITSRPNVSRLLGVPGGYQVYFGTGKFIESADKTNLARQTVYAVQDRPGQSGTLLRANLTQQTIISENIVTNTDTNNYRLTSENALPGTSRGWYMDLYYNADVGERIISDVIIRQEKLIFTTFIPTTNPCDFGGNSWLMELNSYNGTPLNYTPFDVNGDGAFSDADKINFASKNRFVAGRKSTVGVISTPAVLNNGKKEYKITPGSSGSVGSTLENPGSIVEGRQSWRELY